ncbi:PREDICTED: ultraviolet-B receptor UVR8 [Lupinus angustifolius]|uniref:ultraviolet-B receptor UVR8 n=1 Tax=Lupinus angustifolius TaxID=3871 RepID=UPI00092FAF8C|nr:PREDICTED: ultraviolet-B receptor UVR8 [Lupinus angustifolius]
MPEAMADAGNFSNSGNLSHKVIAVAAGEAHTLILTGDGSVYSWGRGMFGRLGLDSEKDEIFPVQVKFQNPNGDTLKIVAIAAGAYHSLALSDDGSVWCWGYNLYGQLGINGEDSNDINYTGRDYSLVPCLLNKFLELHVPDSSTDTPEAEGKESLKICAVKAGGMMSLAIDNHGALWIWGNCPQKVKEGELSLVSNFTPTPVWDFHGHTVVKVACGNEHIVALVSAGESYNGEDLVCYSWGCNSHGQLGLGDRDSRSRPEVVKTFDKESPWAVYEVACGAFHTALLTHKKKPHDTLESTCWTFGLGDNGQLGHGTTQSALFPTPVNELPQNVFFISVDCGLFHTSAVSSAGDVWSWGMEKGLGLCPDASHSEADSGDALLPLLISRMPYQPQFPDPVQVACGAAHTVIVAQEGYKIWSWGRGRSGALGNGREVDFYIPTIVLWPPLKEDFKEEELKSGDEQDKVKEKETEAITETDEKLSSALNEVKLLQSKLSTIEKYAGILHGCVFGKPFVEQDIPASLRNSGSFDIAKEWENMLEAADHRNLMRLEMFYRDMHAGVKDKLMKRRIKEIITECLQSSEVKK